MTAPSESPASDDAAPVVAPRWFAGKGWYWLPVAPLVALDLWSKSAVFLTLRQARGVFNDRATQLIFEFDWLKFEFVNWHNHGTIWGLGQDFHSYLRWLRVGALGLITWFAYKTPPQARWMLISLGLILSGALGNLYDNFFYIHPEIERYNYAVRDFLHFSGSFFGWEWDFPAFNVADSCISVGAVLLFIQLWRTDAAGQSRA